jgi:hypothetical protein
MAGKIKISTLVVKIKDLLFACSRSKVVTASVVIQPLSGHLMIILANISVRVMHSYSTCHVIVTFLPNNKMVKRYIHVKKEVLALLEMFFVN